MTTKTTTHLTTNWRTRLGRWLARQDRWRLIVLALLALPIFSAGVRSLVDSFQGEEQPIIIVATPALPSPLTVTPTLPSPLVETPAYQVAMSAPNHTGACAVIGYSAPSLGAQLGAIEPGRPYTPTGRIDDEWLQAEVAHSGPIWLRPIELACLAAVPDIATPIPPAAPPAAPAVMLAAPARAEPLTQPTVAVPTPLPALPTPAMQLLTAPVPTLWDSEAARQAEREAERQAWESVDDLTPAPERAP